MATKKKGTHRGPIPFDLRLQAVKLYLEEGYTRDMVAEELGVGQSTLTTWAQLYRRHGQEGLRPGYASKGKAKVGTAVKANSPCYYPQYNGGMEAAQREIKARLAGHQQPPSAFLAIQADLDVHALNHQRRPCLGHRTSCAVFASGLALARTFTRRKRREVYDWITQKMLALIEKERYDADAAWRLAVETWLQDHGFITLTNRRKVLPYFPEKRSHN